MGKQKRFEISELIIEVNNVWIINYNERERCGTH